MAEAPESGQEPTRPRGRILRRLLGWLGSALLVLAFLVAGLLALQPRLDVSFARSAFEGAFAAALESPVTIDRVYLRPGLWTVAEFEAMVVAGRDPATSASLFEAGSVEVELGLWAFLHDRLVIRRLVVDGAQAHLEASADDEEETGLSYELVDLLGVEMNDLNVAWVDENGSITPMAWLERVEGAAGQSTPLELTVVGEVVGQPAEASLRSATLPELTESGREVLVEAELSVATSVLRSSARLASGELGQARFELDAPSLDWLFEALETEAPDLGPLALRGVLGLGDGTIALRDLSGHVGTSDLVGELLYRAGEPRGRLTGSLASARLDVTDLGWTGDVGSQDPSSVSGARSGEADDDPLALLEALDAELALTIGQLAAPQVELSQVEATLSLEDGALVLPMSGALGDGRFEGEIGISRDRISSNGIATVVLDARNIGSKELAGLLPELDLDFRVGTLSIMATAPLQASDRPLGGLDLGFEVVDANIDLWGDAATELDVGRLVLRQEAGSGLSASLEGRLVGETVDLRLSASPLDAWLSGAPSTFEMSAIGAGACLDVSGNVNPAAGAPTSDLDLAVGGDRLGDLSAWLGVAQTADLPYEVSGHWSARGDTGRLELERLRLGRTLTSLVATSPGGDAPTGVRITAEAIDLEELNHVMAEVAEVDAGKDLVELEVPLLPGGIHFEDADVEISVERILRAGQTLTDLSATARFRDGRMEPSPFSLSLDQARFAGTLSLDLRADVPAVELDLEATDLDLGRLLRAEGLVEELDLTARRLDLRLQSRPGSGNTMLEWAHRRIDAEGLRWRVTDPASSEELDLELDHARLEMSPAQPLLVTAEGRLSGRTFELRVTPRDEGTAMAPEGPVPLEVALTSGSTRLEARLEVRIPLEPVGEVALSLSGAELAELGPLVGRALPELGAYSFETRVDVTSHGYELRGLSARIGESDLRGDLSLVADGERPRLVGRLQSRRLRAGDLVAPLGEVARGDAEPAASADAPTPVAGSGESSERAEGGTVRELLETLDVDLEVTVDELWVEDVLTGRAVLDVELLCGALDAALELGAVGAEQRLAILVSPDGDEVEARLDARFVDFDYGRLTHLLDPGQGATGRLSLDLDLSSRASTAEDLIAAADGYLAFTLYPADLDSSVLDLWATDLIRTVVDTSDQYVNCVTGRFVARDGMLEAEDFALDTTRIRVRGRGSVDLERLFVDLRLKPRPKQRGFVNLATPVRVAGPLGDVGVSVKRGGFVRTLFRVSMWFYTIYLELLRQPLPADGADICVDPPPRIEVIDPGE